MARSLTTEIKRFVFTRLNSAAGGADGNMFVCMRYPQ